MLYLAAIVITKRVVLFSQQPSARDGTKPWINSQARRAWRTRWRGSLGWDHRVHRINRAKPNRLSSSSQMTSSRWAEHNKPLYMFRAPNHFYLMFCITIVLFCLFFFWPRSSTLTAACITVSAWWITSVVLPKQKSLRRSVLSLWHQHSTIFI